MGCLVGTLTDPQLSGLSQVWKDLVPVRVPVTQLNQLDSPLFPGQFSDIPYLSQLI